MTRTGPWRTGMGKGESVILTRRRGDAEISAEKRRSEREDERGDSGGWWPSVRSGRAFRREDAERKEESAGRSLAAALPFEEHHAGGHRYIQRRNLTRQGDAHEDIAVLAHLLVESAAFAAQHQDAPGCVVDLVVGFGAALIQAVDPHAEIG